jgi:RNA polymerase sigma factor (sigma-70 family)
MSAKGSVTHWFEAAQRGDSMAAEALWKRYYPELVRMARQRLGQVRGGVADEEDVALSAMNGFFNAAKQGRLPNLADRHDLWRLLLRMTFRKATDLVRHETRQRRGGGRTRGESAGESGGPSLALIMGDAPTPEFAAIVAEECRRRLEQLDDAQLQALAVAKMEGCSNEEIAYRLDCSVRTVERRLHLIRRKWPREPQP